MHDFIDPTVPPSVAGCVECNRTGSWWVHLRRCAKCGHVGCCDDSLHRHASAHARATGHRVIQSFEPGEGWFWDYGTRQFLATEAALEPPRSHPVDQSVPGPADRLPKKLGAFARLTL
ncbi:UBP-type zinc finger domain-containing protein [Rhodococcus sovatensis]|uniref:UBP-type zinc finger domain-containing protein n=1 Tax=Rhodococcus sovatensis TaxID=1805840 RepID=A0ABZ2PL25_9NOCA